MLRSIGAIALGLVVAQVLITIFAFVPPAYLGGRLALRGRAAPVEPEVSAPPA